MTEELRALLGRAADMIAILLPDEDCADRRAAYALVAEIDRALRQTARSIPPATDIGKMLLDQARAVNDVYMAGVNTDAKPWRNQ